MRKICKVDGCNKVRKGHGLCNKHYMRIRRNGGAFSLISDIERFEDGFKKANGCWIWEKGMRGEYGTFMMGRKSMAASRASYILFVGDVKCDEYVCHKCDNPACVNPEHLFLGSAADNSADMVAKNRAARGVNNAQNKLSEEDVLSIRSLLTAGQSTRSLGIEYGVSHTNIRNIRDGKAWGWLNG